MIVRVKNGRSCQNDNSCLIGVKNAIRDLACRKYAAQGVEREPPRAGRRGAGTGRGHRLGHAPRPEGGGDGGRCASGRAAAATGRHHVARASRAAYPGLLRRGAVHFQTAGSVQNAASKFQVQYIQERDAGLVVGCVLPPLVLLSRLLAVIYQDQVFSSATFFYAWTSVSVGVSALLKVAVFGSVTSLSVNVLVDVVLLPAAFGLLSPVEAEWRFLLATGGRVFVTTALAAGFKLLPRSFTVGEALLVAQGVGLCAYDLVLSTANRLNEYDVIDLPPNVLHPWLLFDVDRPDYVLALQVGMLGSLLVCIALTPLLRLYGAPSPTTVAHTLPFKGTVGFVLTASMVAGGMVYPWSGFLLQTWNPFGWLLDFLSESRSLPSFLPPRFALMGYWATCLAVLVPFFAFIADRFALRNIVARKLFHLLVVLMLGPASLLDAPMLALSYGVALSVFFLVECIRALALPPFGRSIAEFMRSFIDHREAGQIILTHSYLLLGCALPLWLVPSVSEPSALVMNAGVLALGVGDAMGAVVGSSVGRHKVFGGKTLEGSAAVFLSILIASIPLHDYHTRAYVHGEYIQVRLDRQRLVQTS
ncbi:hypothetical protein ON010_g11325 [Phytophthora cinnamomi]|nr:hypothetical protein ON010_g11325 [Phytophthora cinnamomi]